MVGSKKGQGATEYLVLLAVVLIIALVSIALLGFFPGLAGDARITQSQAYWSGTAQPISIVQYMQSGTTLQLVIESRAPSKLNITGVNADGSSTIAPTSLQLAGGATSTINVTVPACTVGTTFEYNSLVFTYNTNQLTGVKQTGAKSLLGKCS